MSAIPGSSRSFYCFPPVLYNPEKHIPQLGSLGDDIFHNVNILVEQTSTKSEPIKDFVTLLFAIDDLSKNTLAQEPPVNLVSLINLIEAEGFLPPLLCSALRKSGGLFQLPLGPLIFDQLIKATPDGLKLSGEGRAFLDPLLHKPEELLTRFYYIELQRKVNGEVSYPAQDEYFDLPSSLARLERDHSLAFVEKHLSTLPAAIDPRLKDDRAVERRFAYIFRTAEDKRPELLKAELATFFAYLASRVEDPVQRLYFVDLAQKMEGLSETDDPIGALAFFFKAEGLNKQFTDESVCVSESLQKRVSEGEVDLAVKTAAFRTYRMCMILLKDRRYMTQASETEAARQLGRITRSFRQLDDALSKRAGRPLHWFCGCHLRDPNELGKDFSPEKELSRGYPTLDGALRPLIVSPSVKPVEERHKSLSGRSVLIFSCSYGGGHNVVQEAMTKRYAEQGMHVYNMDGEEDALFRSLDIVINLNRSAPALIWLLKMATRLDLRSQTTYYNSVWQKNRLWFHETVQIILQKTAGKYDPQAYEPAIALAICALLERCPDLLTAAYARKTYVWAEAARRLGLPMYSSASDFNPGLTDITLESGAPQNPHFKHVLFYDMPQARNALMSQGKSLLRDEQVVEGGFPVRGAFFKPYSTGELQALRARLMPNNPDTQVVVYVGGGLAMNGISAQEIIKHYRASRAALPKIHLFIICGANKNEQALFEKQLAAGSSKRDGNLVARVSDDLTVEVRGWVSDVELAELYSLATEKRQVNGRTVTGVVVSKKAGGGSISEFAVKGVPLLADSRIPRLLSWETFNLNTYITLGGMGVMFDKESEIVPKLLAMLRGTPLVPKVDFRAQSSPARSMAIAAQLIEDAERDSTAQELRRKNQ